MLFAFDPARKLRTDIEAEGVVRLQRIAGNERGGIGLGHRNKSNETTKETTNEARSALARAALRGGLGQKGVASVK
ncbi:hypothetical protein [Paraburkholderia fungorum]|uniref:hypothetical protein n=1 Tax=Paraburkholderia fungorum TaxID=134537 RepID=UPI00149621EB|nr:hypothetical protein [Paraburkholderia fungorum]